MMMRFLMCFSFLLLGCLQSEKEIVDYVKPLKIDDSNDVKSFELLGSIVADKDIVILGESGHGDGKTHELKSRLIKYLIEEKGFNTFAGEGTGFLDMETLNENSFQITIPHNFLKINWTRSWGNSDSMRNLVNTLEKNQLKYVGLESYTYLISESPEMTVDYLKKNLTELDRIRFAKQLNTIEETLFKTSLFNSTANVSENEIALYIENLKTIKATLKSQNNTEENKPELLIMVIENMISLAKQFKHHIIGTYTAQNVAINIRDEQMAKNLIWYKERHKDSKIIVWTANFHGAKKIRDIRYKEEEPDLYDDYILFGEHLHNEYGNNIYSIAFTSAKGETLNAYWEQTKTTKIDAGKGTLENELYDKGIEYGFLDFSAIRNSSPRLKDEIFNTIILGHDNKPGKWLNVFDGVFFLKTESPLH